MYVADDNCSSWVEHLIHPNAFFKAPEILVLSPSVNVNGYSPIVLPFSISNTTRSVETRSVMNRTTTLLPLYILAVVISRPADVVRLSCFLPPLILLLRKSGALRLSSRSLTKPRVEECKLLFRGELLIGFLPLHSFLPLELRQVRTGTALTGILAVVILFLHCLFSWLFWETHRIVCRIVRNELLELAIVNESAADQIVHHEGMSPHRIERRIEDFDQILWN